MLHFKTLMILCLLAAPAFGSVPTGANKAPPQKEHKTFYHSPLLAPNGSQMSIAQFAQGKPVAVIVMKGTWCFACTDEIKRLDALRAHWQELGVKILALNTQSAHNNRTFQHQAQSSIPIFSDPKGELLNNIGFYLANRDHPLPGALFFDGCGERKHTIKGRRPGRSQDQIILVTLREIKAEQKTCGQVATQSLDILRPARAVAYKRNQQTYGVVNAKPHAVSTVN
jgi:peroxiredoxin